MARKLGEQLLSQQVLTPQQLAQGLKRQAETGQKLGECLVRPGLDETPVLRLLEAPPPVRGLHPVLRGRADLD